MIEEYINKIGEDFLESYRIYILYKVSNAEIKDYFKNENLNKFISENQNYVSDIIIIKSKTKTYTIIRYTKNDYTYDYILNNNSIRILTSKTRKILTNEEKINNMNKTIAEIENKYNLKFEEREKEELTKECLKQEIIIYTYKEKTKIGSKLKRTEAFIKQDDEEIPLLIFSKEEELNLKTLMEEHEYNDTRYNNIIGSLINSFRNINTKDVLLTVAVIGAGISIKKIFHD